MRPPNEQSVRVTCPSCHTTRTVSARHHRRHVEEGRTPDCMACRKLARTQCGETELWYWLKRYGAHRNGLTAAQHVAKHGLPPELQALLDSLIPTRL